MSIAKHRIFLLSSIRHHRNISTHTNSITTNKSPSSLATPPQLSERFELRRLLAAEPKYQSLFATDAPTWTQRSSDTIARQQVELGAKSQSRRQLLQALQSAAWLTLSGSGIDVDSARHVDKIMQSTAQIAIRSRFSIDDLARLVELYWHVQPNYHAEGARRLRNAIDSILTREASAIPTPTGYIIADYLFLANTTLSYRFPSIWAAQCAAQLDDSTSAVIRLLFHCASLRQQDRPTMLRIEQHLSAVDFQRLEPIELACIGYGFFRTRTYFAAHSTLFRYMDAAKAALPDSTNTIGLVVNAMVKCIHGHCRPSRARQYRQQMIEYLERFRDRLDADDVACSVVPLPIAARLASMASSMGYLDERLLKSIYDRLVAADDAEAVRTKDICTFIDSIAYVGYNPAESDAALLKFLESELPKEQIAAHRDGGQRFANSLWSLAALGLYSERLLRILFDRNIFPIDKWSPAHAYCYWAARFEGGMTSLLDEELLVTAQELSKARSAAASTSSSADEHDFRAIDPARGSLMRRLVNEQLAADIDALSGVARSARLRRLLPYADEFVCIRVDADGCFQEQQQQGADTTTMCENVRVPDGERWIVVLCENDAHYAHDADGKRQQLFGHWQRVRRHLTHYGFQLAVVDVESLVGAERSQHLRAMLDNAVRQIAARREDIGASIGRRAAPR